jgi:CDP-diacylglycerol--glycerol-3-phosphate 3-phosphatidyltransferase
MVQYTTRGARKIMFGPGIQQRARRIAEYVVRPLAALGLTPNMATLIGLLLNGLAAAILASGYLRLGGLALLIAGLFDMVDGALARVTNKKTTFGAFFDSTIDRYSEGLTLLGVIIFALRQAPAQVHLWEVALAYIAALGSVMVSYTRARAEGLGFTLKTGLMARPERVVLLAGGLILGGAGWLVWTLLLLAVTSVFTSAQRIFDVARMLARQERVAEGPGAASASARTPTATPVPAEQQRSANGHAAQPSYPATTQVSQVSHVSPETPSAARSRGASGPAK